MAKSLKIKALAYLRTSSMTNSGENGDSSIRQRGSIARFARSGGFDLIAEYADVQSGADALESRPGFMAMLDHVEGNGVRTVIVEDASRFARDLMTQELGIFMLQKRGVTLIDSSGNDLTQTDDAMKKAMRQIQGAFAELEKARLVAKLKGARDRQREKTGKCEGALDMAKRYPKATHRAIELAASAPKPTLQYIAATLSFEGHWSSTRTKSIKTASGAKKRVEAIKQTPFTPMAVWRMLGKAKRVAKVTLRTMA